MDDADSECSDEQSMKRTAERARNAAAHRAARADPERRAAQRLRNAAARRAARADPERRAAEQARNTAARRAARANPGRRATERAANTAARRQARMDEIRREQEQYVPQAPCVEPLLLDRLGELMRFDYLHAGRVVELPDYLMALSEGRVQDLPDGQLPMERQILYETHLQLASSMAAALTRRMPSRVCAVCSELCSEQQSVVYAFEEIPNVELLRADVMCTDAVPRWGRTLTWRRMPCTREGMVPPPPEPVLPMRYRRQRSGCQRSEATNNSGDDRMALEEASDCEVEMSEQFDEGQEGLHISGNLVGEQEQSQASVENQLPRELQPRPPRVLSRPCADDPSSVEVPYCMRLEMELPNRTMYACAATGVDKIYVCSDCNAALSGKCLGGGLANGQYDFTHTLV